VVMGFGIKTDFATGRKLDLNKSYRLLIKPVVEQRGLTCIRADEIRHSGTIDVPMYQELLQADVVIADISTANVNAFYELGIRHALKPRTTIVISEDKMAYPFDLNHIKITSYTHLGDAIDFDEVQRFRQVLGETLDAVLNSTEADSPVYTFLSDLVPPALKQKAEQAVKDLQSAIDKASTVVPTKNSPPTVDTNTLSLLSEQGEQAIKSKQYTVAKALFSSAFQISRTANITSSDDYLIHRLALATYNTKLPDTVTALNDALQLLGQLDLDHTNDPETVALAGAIEKNLYEAGNDTAHLENAILYYQRGYYLLNNRYNGINLAFLLYSRALSTLNTSRAEVTADMVYATRTWKRVLYLCDLDTKELEDRASKASIPVADTESQPEERPAESSEKVFFIFANKAEAHYGLGETDACEQARAEAGKVPHDEWMMESFQGQLENLMKLKEKAKTLNITLD
ncbi:MAG: TRAFs-binding domain-containing protein, partial [Chitinophagaceae bacterium]